MFKPEDEYIPDLSISCNKDVAVAKLLGWMRGIRRAKEINITEHGISEEQLPLLHSMGGSLQELLYELREAARQDLITAAENDASSDELEEKEKAAIEADSRLDKAFMYYSDIEEELSNGQDSTLKIDQETTGHTGVIHITLNSLDKWALGKYGISIMDNKQTMSPDNMQVRPINQNIDEDLYPKGGLTQTTANNILTTLGFLIEAFAQTATRFGKDKSKPNIKQISEHIAALAAKASGTDEMDNQSAEAIRKRLTEAMKIKNSHFQQR